MPFIIDRSVKYPKTAKVCFGGNKVRKGDYRNSAYTQPQLNNVLHLLRLPPKRGNIVYPP